MGIFYVSGAVDNNILIIILSNEYVCKICLVSGQLENELACVKFGLITDDTDIEELLEHVIKCGKEIEESSRVRF